MSLVVVPEHSCNMPTSFSPLLLGIMILWWCSTATRKKRINSSSNQIFSNF